MKKTIFTGAGVAIVTPMHDDLSINWELLGELIDYQIDNGTEDRKSTRLNSSHRSLSRMPSSA